MKLRSGSFYFALACLTCLTVTAQAQIQFDRPKTEPPLPNPYTVGAPRDQIIKTTREVFKTCAVTIDDEASKPAEGKLVTKYYVFTKGVNARNDLAHVSNLPASEVRNWTQGRYYLEIIALPLDEKRSQLQIIVHLQGQVGDVMGNKWIDRTSNGELEDEILRGLAGKILGVDLSVKGNNRRRMFNCEY
jgi:hypothetical protein